MLGKILFKTAALCAVVVGGLTACGEAGKESAPEQKPVTKIAEIYFRYGTEAAARSSGAWNEASYKALMNSETISKGARCVQDRVVSKGRGLYRETRLQSLLLKHVFPADLSTYSAFVDDAAVHNTALVRLKKLGFASYEAAIKSNNMIVRSLLTEYTHYARFRNLHDVSKGVQASNAVINSCAPNAITNMLGE
ncbi:MAG: hypothetical protein KUG56_08190 [Kordiimonadaceae bacterium]|nr:hypothetical protein [Kordiimonadaceae bacterium]